MKNQNTVGTPKRPRLRLILIILAIALTLSAYGYGAMTNSFMYYKLGGEELHAAYARLTDPTPPTSFYVQVGEPGFDGKCYRIEMRDPVTSAMPWREREMEIIEEHWDCDSRIYRNLPAVSLKKAPTAGIAQLANSQ